MARRRGRSSKKKSNKLLFELGIAVILLLTIYILMSSVSMSIKTKIYTIPPGDDSKIIIFYAKWNVTSKTFLSHIVREYNLSDIASATGDYAYISIPDIDDDPNDDIGYTLARFFIEIPYSYSDLVNRGLNKIIFRVYVLNDTAIESYTGVSGARSLALFKIDGSTIEIVKELYEYNKTELLNNLLFNCSFEFDIDPGDLAIASTSHEANNYNLSIGFEGLYDISGVYGFKIRIEFYTISEKPILKFLTEPFAMLWGALVGAFYSLWEKMKSVVLGAFSGASLGAVFTGLVENPYLAILLTSLVFLIIAYFAYEKRSRRRRR